jgi:hypothetical protein
MQLELITPLDTNLLPGDRIPITLASETQLDGTVLSAVNFDLIRVEHNILKEGGTSKAMLTSIPTLRYPVQTTDPITQMRFIKERAGDWGKGVRNIH